MRGCFVYNKVNGHNLFFPIGASGHGRRASDHLWYHSPTPTGTLQYAWRNKKYSKYDYTDGWSTLMYRPMFENIYMRPGAVYWCEKLTDEGNNGQCYLDINYFTSILVRVEKSHCKVLTVLLVSFGALKIPPNEKTGQKDANRKQRGIVPGTIHQAPFSQTYKTP